MKKIRNSLFYVLVIGGLSALIYWLIRRGAHLQTGRVIQAPKTSNSRWEDFVHALTQNLEHPLALLLAQIITIILVARFFGWLCRKIGQPSVIGEIVAGIVMGPSLVGAYFPEFSAFLFPKQSLGNLQFLSQIGLILFMFVIGMELDLKVLRNKAKDSVVISHASIIFPFALGVGLALLMYKQFAPPNINFASFALFTGIAMSITAFPVLARIIQERNIHKTKLGTIVITCAAADDITAWCLLAFVIAIVKAGSFVSALFTIGLSLTYVLLMIYMVRPFLKRVGDLYATKESLSKGIVAIFFLVLIISSYATEIIGIHALFGAFMAGAIMPDNARFRSVFVEKVEDISVLLLLPLFFVFTGLRTQIGLLNDPYLWKMTGLIILVAVTGKFIGSALAARFVGQNWRDSLTIGALMNTRGLMELVVLNIGYDLGVLKPDVFAMMVIMALVTTFMTGPALDLINWGFGSKDKQPGKEPHYDRYNILLSFANAQSGKALLRMAHAFMKGSRTNTSVTAMHLTPVNEIHLYNIEEYEKESFAPLIEESERLNQQITTLFKASGNIDAEIAEMANKGNYDLLLVSVEHSIYEGSLLGKILGFTTRIINPDRLIGQVAGREGLFEDSPFDEHTKLILGKSNIPVGVFIDKGLTSIQRIFVATYSEKDAWIAPYVEKLSNGTKAIVSFGGRQPVLKKPAVVAASGNLYTTEGNAAAFTGEEMINKDVLQQQDLVVISAESWRKLIESKTDWLADMPSALILATK